MGRELFVGLKGIVSHNGKMYFSGAPFPAADLGLDDKSVKKLLKAGFLTCGRPDVPIEKGPAPKKDYMDTK